MKEYTTNDPVFSKTIHVTETTDPAHADNINAAPEQLLQNTLCNRKSIEELKKSIGTGDAGEYNIEVGYQAGEYCLYDGVMYKCLEDTEGEWNPESWQETSPVEEIINLRKSLDSLISLFRTDAEGNLLQLGEAAFAGISHNFVTEGKNFVAGADLLKTLKEQVDQQNSALENGGLNIVKRTVTKTTDGSGNITLDTSDNDACVIACYSDINNYACIPFVHSNSWRAHVIVINTNTFKVLASTSITVNVYIVKL